MIDALGVGYGCQGSVYKQGQTYDFYIVNLTPDGHPIHIHILNFQVVGRFAFNVDKYRDDWVKKNGKLGRRGYTKAPKQLDPRPYRNGPILSP
jgi:FtsP/CotA-like multicopper oxidase with cupredoxin domain